MIHPPYETVSKFPPVVPLGNGVFALYFDTVIAGFTIPAGSKTDFGSVPFFIRWLISKTDPSMIRAFILHDYLVNQFGDRAKKFDGITWERAARIMRAQMKTDGTPLYKRSFAYHGVIFWGKIRKLGSYFS